MYFSAKCRLVILFAFLKKISYIKGIHNLTALSDGSQEVVANILREQSIVEMVSAPYSHFVLGHEDWVDCVED